MVLTDRNTGGGRAWQFLCCNAAYRPAWRRRHPQPGLPEQAPFQVLILDVVIEAGNPADAERLLAASRWGLLAWADPDEEDDPISPFWLKAPMLQIAISPDATPLVPGMTALAAPLSGTPPRRRRSRPEDRTRAWRRRNDAGAAANGGGSRGVALGIAGLGGPG